MGFKVGICGLGFFGRHFIPLFKRHPLCDEVVLCELREDVLAEHAKEHGVSRTFRSFDELLASDVDAVAIFTQRWTHAPMAIKALKAGKHVYSAVPAGVTLEELDELIKTVEETGLTYALGETGFYCPQTIYCRKRYARGDFGRFVYGEGQYCHNMSSWFYLPFYDANGPEWKRYASVPPMWYTSHSVSYVLGVTFGRFTKASCYGFADGESIDGLFDPELSAFNNPWSNQSAFFRTSDGGMARINEFRRTGAGHSSTTIMGTQGAYYEQPNPQHGQVTVAQEIEGREDEDRKDTAACNAVWTEVAWKESPYDENGNLDYVKAQHVYYNKREDLTHIHRVDGVEITGANLGGLPGDFVGRTHLGVSSEHPVERLPAEYVGLPNGHRGSHQFLVQDFFEAMNTGKLPPNHVWLGARYIAPGIVAHESCKREGELLPIPDFGVPPRGRDCIDPLVKLQA